MHEELIEKVEELIQIPREWPWFEFKENWYEPVQLGEYISFSWRYTEEGVLGKPS